MKNRMLLSVLNVLLISLLFSPNVFSQATVVSVVPASVPSPRVGQQFTVDIDIRNGRNVAGYQVMLHFNFPAIEYVKMEPGDYLPANAFYGDKHFMGGHGTMLFAATASPQERNGNGTLARLTFKINEIEPSTFRLSAGDLSRPRHGTFLSNKDIDLSVPRLENAEMFRGVGASDLVVESPRVSDTTVGPGDEFTLTATVRNQGGGITPGIHLFYYRSTDPHISRRTDTQVGSRSLSSLGANRSDTVRRTLTAPTSPGTYYYGACVNSYKGEADPNNNCSEGVKVTVTQNRLKPGLVVQSVSPSKPTVSPGERFTLSATVANRGTAESKTTTLQFYRSSNDKITTSDTHLRTVTVGGLGTPLGGRSTSTERITITAPTAPGTYYYGACVDRGGGETHCSDAVKVTVQRASVTPDLVIESVRAEPSTVAPGEKFKLYATLKNRGTGRSAATTLRYYRSDNAIISTSDTQIGSGVRNPLDPNGTITKQLDVPAPTTPGTYYYGVCVDEVDNESNTGNNCYIDAVPVEVTLDAISLEIPPDLISDVAYGGGSTYFVLNAQFPTLKDVKRREVVYKDCTITLDIPGVSDHSLSTAALPLLVEYVRQLNNFVTRLSPISLGNLTRELGLFDADGPLDLFPEERQYFIFPLQSIDDKKREIEAEAHVGTTIAILGIIPVAGDIVNVAAAEAKRVMDINELLQSIMDPKIGLKPQASWYDDILDFLWGIGRPDDLQKYALIFPDREVTSIGIKVEQEYVLRSDPNTTHTAIYEETRKLTTGTFAAPSARPMTLADYPPFQQLPLEVQAYLLQHFGEGETAEAWRIPEQSALLVNYPNPFNPETWIPYKLAEPADVALTIYDIHGRVVRDLNLGHQGAGLYQSKSRAAYWDGRNVQGEPVASGVYFYTLKAGTFSATRKMLIRK